MFKTDDYLRCLKISLKINRSINKLNRIVYQKTIPKEDIIDITCSVQDYDRRLNEFQNIHEKYYRLVKSDTINCFLTWENHNLQYEGWGLLKLIFDGSFAEQNRYDEYFDYQYDYHVLDAEKQSDHKSKFLLNILNDDPTLKNVDLMLSSSKEMDIKFAPEKSDFKIYPSKIYVFLWFRFFYQMPQNSTRFTSLIDESFSLFKVVDNNLHQLDERESIWIKRCHRDNWTIFWKVYDWPILNLKTNQN